MERSVRHPGEGLLLRNLAVRTGLDMSENLNANHARITDCDRALRLRDRTSGRCGLPCQQ